MKKNESLSIWKAMEIVASYARETESMTVEPVDGLGMILAEDVTTRIFQPPFPRSAMDGYAVKASDTKGACSDSPVCLKVVGCQIAGMPYFRPLQKGEALRIMTGAAIPEGADAVIRQEDTDYGEEVVSIYHEAVSWDNYCQVGEDFPQGDVLALKGDRVDAYLIASAVAGGIDHFLVRKPVRAAVLTTGDELQQPGEELKEGKIYNSNLALFQTRLTQLGCQVDRAFAVGDDLDLLVKEIREAADHCDLIITTGGVSVGIKDLLPEAMETLGAEIIFHGISIKPGMPTLFSVLDGVPVISLSGNPYSASAVFELLTQPLLKVMNASNREVLAEVTGQALDTFPKKSVCTRFLRGYYDQRGISFGRGQRNGQTKAGIGSNCLICLEAGREKVEIGDQLTAYLLYQI